MKFPFLSKFSPKEYVLVISGGGARGAYALGILQGLEELGLDKQIKAIYGVSAGAIVGSYRSAGYTARDAYERFVDLFTFGITKINLLPKKSLIKNDFLRKTFKADLPTDFSKLKKTLYIGASNTKKGEFKLFNSGDLITPLMGSMAMPGVFEAIPYQDMLLVDGGNINNFPVEEAKEKYPKAEIIGIALNKFEENKKIKNIFDSLVMSYDLLFRGPFAEKNKLVDHLFYRNLPVAILDTNEKNMRKTFRLGYQDCLDHFKK